MESWFILTNQSAGLLAETAFVEMPGYIITFSEFLDRFLVVPHFFAEVSRNGEISGSSR